MSRRTTRLGSLVIAALLATSLASGCGSQASTGSGTATLESAFGKARDATSYRLTSFTAQKLSSSLLGVDTETEIDEDRPTSTAEITPTGSHVLLDLSALFGPMLGSDEQIGIEMWLTADRLTLDSRDYARLKEANPGRDLGPFEPGIAYIDRRSASASDSELMGAILGQGIPDLAKVAVDLPRVLEDIKQDGSTITGGASYADVVTALGQDVEQTARGIAAGLALNIGVDVEELTAFYVSYYEDTRAEVTIELDTDGLLSSIGFTADLSGIYTRIFDSPELFAERPSEEDLAGARELASDTEWVITMLQRYEIDDDLVVDPAPATDDDRTDEWVLFFKSAGF